LLSTRQFRAVGSYMQASVDRVKATVSVSAFMRARLVARWQVERKVSLGLDLVVAMPSSWQSTANNQAEPESDGGLQGCMGRAKVPIPSKQGSGQGFSRPARCRVPWCRADRCWFRPPVDAQAIVALPMPEGERLDHSGWSLPADQPDCCVPGWQAVARPAQSLLPCSSMPLVLFSGADQQPPRARAMAPRPRMPGSAGTGNATTLARLRPKKSLHS